MEIINAIGEFFAEYIGEILAVFIIKIIESLFKKIPTYKNIFIAFLKKANSHYFFGGLIVFSIKKSLIEFNFKLISTELFLKNSLMLLLYNPNKKNLIV
ncbi:MAG: hypothetical protein NXH90_14160 [Flavobacteriaceae bacterium]|nr:hypothetical protein [Flavobacteriaceae bacterium]